MSLKEFADLCIQSPLKLRKASPNYLFALHTIILLGLRSKHGQDFRISCISWYSHLDTLNKQNKSGNLLYQATQFLGEQKYWTIFAKQTINVFVKSAIQVS